MAQGEGYVPGGGRHHGGGGGVFDRVFTACIVFRAQILRIHYMVATVYSNYIVSRYGVYSNSNIFLYIYIYVYIQIYM